MPLERFVIEELGGVNRNLVDGLGKQPDELKNLKFDRAGGWRYYGARDAVGNVFGYEPFYQMVNRYGVYFGDSFIYRVHDVVTNSLVVRVLNKDLTNAGPGSGGESLANADGSTNYFAIPRVRYGPYVDYLTGLGVSPDQATTPVAPNVAVTWTNGSANGNLNHNRIFLGLYAAWVQTRGGKYIFAHKRVTIYPIDYGATTEGRLNFTVQAPPSGSIPAGVQYGIDIYVIGESPAFVREYEGFLGTGLPGDVVRYADYESDLAPSSEIFVEGHSSRTTSHQGRYYYVQPQALGGDYVLLADAFFGLGYEIGVGPVMDIRRYGRGPDNVIVYSEAVPSNYAVNAVRALNFFVVTPEAGAGINALMSSPAGLLVFCENEIFLFHGDPASSPSLVRYSGTIGNTPGSHPVSLAGIVFWSGYRED